MRYLNDLQIIKLGTIGNLNPYTKANARMLIATYKLVKFRLEEKGCKKLKIEYCILYVMYLQKLKVSEINMMKYSKTPLYLKHFSKLHWCLWNEKKMIII